MQNESFFYRPPAQNSHLIVTADHATNIVPEWVNDGDLGIAEADMNRHIAYDIGVMGVCETLAVHFDAHLIATQFSRLVIDPNRGADDPTSIMKVYDRTVIPANRKLSEEQKQERVSRLYQPYHKQLGEVISSIQNAGSTPVIIAIHSFTPQLNGRAPRPWHVGVLSAEDRRIADPLIQAFEAEGEWVVGDNEPYKGALTGDTLDQHGIHQNIPHALIEVRNDLIETPESQRQWGIRLGQIIETTLKQEGFL